MASTLVRLARQSGVYALGNLALKASGLVLAFVYLDPAYLSQEAFGYLSLLEAVGKFVMLVAVLGLPVALIRFAAREAVPPTSGDAAAEGASGSAAEARRVFGTVWVLALASGVVVGAGLWAAAAPLAAWLLDDAGEAGLVRLLGAFVAAKVVAEVPYAILRQQERPGAFLAGVVGETTLLVGGVYALVVGRGMGLDGVLWAYVGSAGATAVALSALVAPHLGGFDRRLVRPLVAFGVPLIAAGLASRFLNLGDRFLIDALLGPADVAVYEWASRLAGVVNMLFVQGFQMAFTVLGIKALAVGEGVQAATAAFHRSAFRHFAIWTGWGVLGLALLAVDVTRLVAEEEAYLAIEPLVLPIALGFFGYGLYFIAVTVLYSTGRTRAVAVTVGAAALGNVALNLALIPVLGLLGAALATAGAYALLAVATAWQAGRTGGVRYPWRVVGVVLVLVVGLWALGQPSAAWGVGPRLAVRAALLGAYPLLVLATGLYDRADLRRGWELAKGLRGDA